MIVRRGGLKHRSGFLGHRGFDLDVMFIHFCVECGAGKVEQLGGPGAVAAGHSKGFADQYAGDPPHRTVEKILLSTPFEGLPGPLPNRIIGVHSQVCGS